MDGLAISYLTSEETSGQLPVVVLHGLGMSTRLLEPLLLELAAHVDVIAPDMPGCGLSDKPPQALGVDDLTAWVCAWSDEIGLTRADWVGHSLGGQVVARLAARHPGRVRRAVLIAAPPDPSAPKPWQKILRVLQDAVHEPPRVIAAAVRDYVRSAPVLALRTLAVALNADAPRIARQVAVPTLVVRGSRDRVVRNDWASELTRLIPTAEHVVIPDGTHALPAQAPVALAREIVSFLTR